MKKLVSVSFVCLVLVIMSFPAVADKKADTALFVRGVEYTPNCSIATVQVEQLPIRQAIRKSHLHSEILKEMEKLRHFQYIVITDVSGEQRMTHPNRDRLDKLENELIAIKGQIFDINMPLAETNGMQYGTVIQRRLVEKELVEKHGNVAVYRHNFWKTEVVRY